MAGQISGESQTTAGRGRLSLSPPTSSKRAQNCMRYLALFILYVLLLSSRISLNKKNGLEFRTQGFRDSGFRALG